MPRVRPVVGVPLVWCLAFVLQNQMKSGFVCTWALLGGPGEIAIYGY